MKHIIFYIRALIISSFLFSCSGNKPSSQKSADSKTSTDTTHQVNKSSADESATNSSRQMLDTAKLNSDLSNMISSMNGKPDTTKLKNAAADILSTDANMLSDSGIDKMYGNSNDPSVIAAKNALLKMRNSMGITPDKLDSMKKSAAMLRDNGISNH